MIFTILLTVFCLLFNYTYASNVFNGPLLPNNNPISYRNHPGLGYCDSLDIMFLFGGKISNTRLNEFNSLNTSYYYNFSSKILKKIQNFSAPLLYYPEVHLVNSSKDNCFFISFGGYEFISNESQLNKKTYLIKLTRKVSDIGAEVSFFINQNMEGRVRGGSAVYKTNICTINGYFKSIQSHPNTQIWCLNFTKFNFQTDRVQDWPKKKLDWNLKFPIKVNNKLRIYNDIDSIITNFDFASSYNRSTGTWLIHGGRHLNNYAYSKALVQIDLEKFLGSPSKPGEWFRNYVKSSDQFVYRYGHVSAILNDFFITYGGFSPILTSSSFIVLNSIKPLITKSNQAQLSNTCNTTERSTSPFCIIDTPHNPDWRSDITGIQRKDVLYFWYCYDPVSQNKAGCNLFNLSLKDITVNPSTTNAWKSIPALFWDRQRLFWYEEEIFTTRLLEFTLAIVGCLLFVTLVLLFKRSHFSRNNNVPQSKPVKVGITPETIRSLEHVLYDTKKNHKTVIIKYSNNIPVVVSKITPVPQSHNDANNLELKNDSESELCAICIVEFNQDEIVQRLRCKHIFHCDCIHKWLLKNGSCPTCRTHVITGERTEDSKSQV